MKRAKHQSSIRVALAVMTAITVMAPISASADTAWPLPVWNTRAFGPTLRSDGARWCGQSYGGSYGSSMFYQTEAWVNYGGTCNAQWGQPAGRLTARLTAWTAGSYVNSYSGKKTNSSNSWYVQATVPRQSGDSRYEYWGEWIGPSGSDYKQHNISRT